MSAPSASPHQLGSARPVDGVRAGIARLRAAVGDVVFAAPPPTHTPPFPPPQEGAVTELLDSQRPWAYGTPPPSPEPVTARPAPPPSAWSAFTSLPAANAEPSTSVAAPPSPLMRQPFTADFTPSKRIDRLMRRLS